MNNQLDKYTPENTLILKELANQKYELLESKKSKDCLVKLLEEEGFKEKPFLSQDNVINHYVLDTLLAIEVQVKVTANYFMLKTSYDKEGKTQKLYEAVYFYDTITKSETKDLIRDKGIEAINHAIS